MGTPYKISSFAVGSTNFTNVFGEPIVITRDNVKKPKRTSSYYTVAGPFGSPAKIVTQELLAGLVSMGGWLAESVFQQSTMAGQVCVSTVDHGCGWAWPGLGQGLAIILSGHKLEWKAYAILYRCNSGDLTINIHLLACSILVHFSTQFVVRVSVHNQSGFTIQQI